MIFQYQLNLHRSFNKRAGSEAESALFPTVLQTGWFSWAVRLHKLSAELPPFVALGILIVDVLVRANLGARRRGPGLIEWAGDRWLSRAEFWRAQRFAVGHAGAQRSIQPVDANAGTFRLAGADG